MRTNTTLRAMGLLAAILAFPAWATFHLMKVVEVFPGTAASPNAQYVVIQMYASGQNFVGGHAITVFDGSGALVSTFTFPGNVSNAANQADILIATSEAQSFFGVTADLTMSAALISAGGKVCWAGTIDCVAWGAYTGSATGVGTPYNAANGLKSGKAAKRRLDISGSASVLDAGDDTDNSANDFVEGLPAPRNNANVSGTIPSATCGNGAIEGLEECDDHNLADGDGCSSTCAITPVLQKLSIGDVAISEGNSGTKIATFTVSLSQTSASPVTYDIATANGTATAGSDYVASSLIGQSIAAGATSKTFSVTINGDTSIEPNETFTVNVSNVSGAGVADAQAIGTITNDDFPALSIGDVAISEGNSGTKLATFTVSLSVASTTAVTYNIATANGTATAGSDYVASSLSGQSIAAGATSKTFAVTINGDVTPEANETFTVNLSGASGATIADAQAIGTIINDDGAALSIADVAISEGNSGTKLATFTVKLSQVAAGTVTYNIATANGTATAGSDYVASTLTGQSIAAGQPSKSFTVAINGDAAVEANETFTVNLSSSTGATISDAQAIGTIVNDDGPTLSINDVTTTEGNSGTKVMTFTVALSQAAAVPVSFNFFTAFGPATAGVDYVASSLSGQSIPVGQLTKKFNVTINGDATVEANEYFAANLSNVVGATVFDSQGIGTILNDDGPTLSIADVALSEGNSGTTKLATFTVKLSPAAAVQVTYNIGTANGTAAAGSDYVASTLTGQSIAAGATSKTFTVTINGDATVEANETLSVNLSSAAGATILDSQAIGTILNDDGPTLSVNNVTLNEGNTGTQTMTFTVSLSQVAAVPVSYDIFTAFGPATPGVDYVASSLTGQSIPAGQPSKTFAVTINGDTTVEPSEYFAVNLSNAVGASIFDSQGIGTITNDDGAAAIATIQGEGPISALVGQSISTQGVVTAVTSAGFFLQTPDAEQDENPATSEAVFVASHETVSPGQQVEVQGQVQEVTVGDDPNQLTLTRIAAASVQILADVQKLPSPIGLKSADLDPRQTPGWLERYEGMRVALPSLRVVAPVSGKGESYGVLAGIARPFREPGISALDRVSSKSGVSPPVFDTNPERLRVDSQGQLGASRLAVDVGDSITGLVGVLGYGYGSYRILPDPRSSPTVVPGAAPKAASAPDPTQITMASLNLHGLLDAPDESAGTAAATTHSYALRLAKIANGICAYMRSPAIVAVTDVKDLAALSDLASAINSNAGNVLFPGSCQGNPEYRAFVLSGNSADGNTGVLVSTAQVRPGVPRVNVLSVNQFEKSAMLVQPDGSREALHEYPPLLLRATVNSRNNDSGVDFTVMMDHLTALDGNPAQPGPHGWSTRGDYQRARRDAQASSLAKLIQDRQRRQPLEKLVVLGEFNAPEFNEGYDDVMGAVTGREAARNLVLHHVGSAIDRPLTNLTLVMPASERYTITHDGNAEAVDHILVNQPLLQGFDARAEAARVNADFGADNADDFTVPVRFSDHDPVVIYLSAHAPRVAKP